jgi:signal transduction histidine kinase
VESIRRQLRRLQRLVDELLDVSRLADGRMTLTLDEVELGELAREVAARFADELEAAGCALRVRAATRVIGLWDRMRLDQVVTNLLTNAMKYGRGQPIEVVVDGDDERARLLVRDRGIGIAAEDQARIFERFERAVSERNFGGFGLGLWIVARIVKQLGGTVSVQSALGAGATFNVELPLSPSEVAG